MNDREKEPTKDRAFEEMLDALQMIYDADEDCRRDNLPQIPGSAKAILIRALLIGWRWSSRDGQGFFAPRKSREGV